MDKYYAIVAGRELGTSVPCSISTALALESVFGLSPDRPEYHAEPPILKHQALWVNVRTLIRNIITSVPSSDHSSLYPDPLYDAITSEMQIIRAAVDSASVNRCKVTYYYQTHASLTRKYDYRFLKLPKTEKQKFVAGLESVLLERVRQGDLGVVVSDLDLPDNQTDALIITHQPIDLLSRYRFKRLTLLESHTGKLKVHTQWSSKLTGGSELARIPFNHVTLQLFGDGGMFQTFPSKEKKQFIEMAELNQWTPTTTVSRMRQNIDGYPFHPVFKALLVAMF